MKSTGWPPGLLQDDSRKLSDWFASRVDARWTVRRVCAEIERNRMTDKQTYALRVADALKSRYGQPPDGSVCDVAADLIRTQHAAIERKDALLRQAMEQMGGLSVQDLCQSLHHKMADQHTAFEHCRPAERFQAVWHAITKELQ